MTSKAVVRSGMDVNVRRTYPSKTFTGLKTLALQNGTDECQALIYFKSPVPRGATVLSAVLRFRAYGNSAGFKSLIVRRVMASWSAGRVTWKTRPAITGGNATTVYVGTVKHGDYIEVPVTADVQAWANGSANYGWRLETDGPDVWRLAGLRYADYGRPTLEVTWAVKPGTPTGLVPNGAVSIAKPVLQFDYTAGTDALARVEIQIDPNKNGTSPAWSAGIGTTEPQIRLAETSFPGLSADQATFWRVRVTDAGGFSSGWSAWASLTRAAKSSATITVPSDAPNNVVWDVSPLIGWEFVPSTSALFTPTQAAWQVLIAPLSAPTRYVYDSGKRAGTDTDHEVAKPVLLDDTAYRVYLRVWDSLTTRQNTPGDPPYVQVSKDFTVDDDLILAPPEAVVGVQVDKTPNVRLTWTRGAVPDRWTILRDGEVILSVDGIEPLDETGDGTTYAWTDVGAVPNRDHVYDVKAVTNNRQSVGGSTVTVHPRVEGVWITDPDTGAAAAIWGDDGGTWDTPDDASVYTPVGSTEVVRIVTGMRGYEGSLNGFVMDGFGRTFEDHLATLYAIKERPTTRFQIVAGDVTFPALVGNVKVSPSPKTRRGQQVRNVSFDFWQSGGLPFTVRL